MIDLFYKNANFCPYCQSKDIKSHEKSTTLLGYFSDDPEDDPNHITESCECLSCKKSYFKHWVPLDKNCWFVDNNGTIILGKPTCCESSYKSRCDCGGLVDHVFENKHGIKSSIYCMDEIGPMQIGYWECDSCKKIIPDFYQGYNVSTWELLAKAREILKEKYENILKGIELLQASITN